MNNIAPHDIKNLFQNLCCSKCKNDFTYESLVFKKFEGDIIICKLVCQKCGKDLGDIVFNFNKKSRIHNAMEIIEGPPAISIDDVIDAHNFLNKNL